MTAAYNVVRMKVKPGREKEFLDKQKSMGAKVAGMRKAVMIKTGDRSYCIIGEWDRLQSLVNARPGAHQDTGWRPRPARRPRRWALARPIPSRESWFLISRSELLQRADAQHMSLSSGKNGEAAPMAPLT